MAQAAFITQRKLCETPSKTISGSDPRAETTKQQSLSDSGRMSDFRVIFSVLKESVDIALGDVVA